MIRRVIATILSSLCWRLLALLRNRKRVPLTREEIRHLNLTFSAYGEDLVVLSYFTWYGHEDERKDRLYIDVGAFDPTNQSTTLLLYKSGWRGINVDLDYEKIGRFEKARPDDHNVVAAVAAHPGKARQLKYGLGTTNRIVDMADTNLLSLCNELPASVSEVETTTLTDILDASPFRNRTFDYLNVDCEGRDLDVLQSLDFARYAPSVITVEAFTQQERDALHDFLGPKGYGLTAVLRYTLVFVKDRAEKAATASNAGCG